MSRCSEYGELADLVAFAMLLRTNRGDQELSENGSSSFYHAHQDGTWDPGNSGAGRASGSGSSCFSVLDWQAFAQDLLRY